MSYNYLTLCVYFVVEVCPSLVPPSHSTLNTDIAIYGTTVTVTCRQGYHFRDITTVKESLCLGADGWSVDITGHHGNCIRKYAIANAIF
jgi:hypothetical protein